MISIEELGKKIVHDLSAEYGASTITRKAGEDQIRVEVASGQKRFAWYFSRYADNKSAALRDIDADMRQALRKVGLITDVAISPALERASVMPRALAGPIGDKIREAIVKRIRKPVETDQPDVSFPHVAIPEKKVPKEISALRKRLDAIERDMASVKQITDQLR